MPTAPPHTHDHHDLGRPDMIEKIPVTCGDCGAEVDVVEYDPDAKPSAVADVMTALGLDEAEAVKIVKRHNPDGALTQKQAAQQLAAQIADRSVPDRAKSTYACPTGCKAPKLVVGGPA